MKKKQGELDIQSSKVASHQDFYNDAKKFVNGGLDGDEKKVAARCMEFFGKKKMSQKEAETALKKLETTLKDFQKEERILQDEVKLLTGQVNEGDKRLKALETDLSRSVESLKIGGLTPEQFNVVKSNFEKTLAIK